MCHHSIGRGGDGHHFVFGLVDWQNTPVGERRGYYLGAGGDPAMRVTFDRWRAWLTDGTANHANLQALLSHYPTLRGSDMLPEDIRDLSLTIVIDN